MTSTTVRRVLVVAVGLIWVPTVAALLLGLSLRAPGEDLAPSADIVLHLCLLFLILATVADWERSLSFTVFQTANALLFVYLVLFVSSAEGTSLTTKAAVWIAGLVVFGGAAYLRTKLRRREH